MISTVQEVEEEQASDYGSQIKIAQMNLPTMRYIKRQTKTSLSFMSKYWLRPKDRDDQPSWVDLLSHQLMEIVKTER